MSYSKFDLSIVASVVFASVLISSCASDSENEIIIEKTVVQNVDSAAIMEGDTTVSYLEDEVLGLTQQNEEEKQTIKGLNQKIQKLNSENDNLKTSINQKNKVIEGLANEKQKPIGNDELHARALVQSLNEAWVALPGAKNTDAFMTLFLPEFAVSMVSVGIDDKADVQMLYKDDFIQLLNRVRTRENLALQIGNVDFVYFDGRNDIYSIVYTAILRSYVDDVATVDRSFVATVTVKKLDGEFKIGKLSWASMGHDLQK